MKFDPNLGLHMSYDKKGRYYYKEESPQRKFYSVSTINRWMEPKIKSNDGSKIGTLIHYQILRNYTDEFIEVPTDNPYWEKGESVNQKIEDAIQMWKQLELDEVVEEWLAVEQAVYYETTIEGGEFDGMPIGYAGRLDILARFNDGKTRIIDLKTGDEYPDYFEQMGGYVQAVGHCLGIYVDEVWITYLDVGGNFNKDLNIYFKRNEDRIPRIVVMDRAKIDESIGKFNVKLRCVYEGISN